MSWVRFGSKCEVACPGCPGSSVYVFFNSDGFYECQRCQLRIRSPEIVATWFDTAEKMRGHLRAHVAAGDHVDPSLLAPPDDGDEERSIIAKVGGR